MGRGYTGLRRGKRDYGLRLHRVKKRGKRGGYTENVYG